MIIESECLKTVPNNGEEVLRHWVPVRVRKDGRGGEDRSSLSSQSQPPPQLTLHRKRQPPLALPMAPIQRERPRCHFTSSPWTTSTTFPRPARQTTACPRPARQTLAFSRPRGTFPAPLTGRTTTNGTLWRGQAWYRGSGTWTRTPSGRPSASGRPNSTRKVIVSTDLTTYEVK